jgi:isopenicillin N synthase-like dioxygenase
VLFGGWVQDYLFRFLLLFSFTSFAMDHIPVIEFGLFDSDPKAAASAIRSACESIGFLYLTNFGIPQTEVDRAFSLVSL